MPYRPGFVRRCLTLCLLAATLAACETGTGTLSDLQGVEQLQDRFSEDENTIRIVLLLSPT